MRSNALSPPFAPARAVLFMLLSLCLAAACTFEVAAPRAHAPSPACMDDERVLNVGFYAFFAPVSYSASEDPESREFHTHLGYETDLLTALEAIDGAGLSFSRYPIAAWDDIWLQAAAPQYDIIGGGITVLDARTRDASGRRTQPAPHRRDLRGRKKCPSKNFEFPPTHDPRSGNTPRSNQFLQ